MTTNVSTSETQIESISQFLSIVGQPARIQILVIIGAQEACVCHLEAVLGMRQASISQHLMLLRKTGLVTSHRDGRNIFYRLAHPEVVDLIYQSAQFVGISRDQLAGLALRPVQGCTCPQCNPGIDPELACRNTNSAHLS